LAVVFAEIGQEVHVVEGNYKEAINEGVKEALSKRIFAEISCR